jgi:Flp pilus assembly protein TadD
VELKPKSARYRLRLAEALERVGRTEEAREARRWADAVQIEPLCPGMQP